MTAKATSKLSKKSLQVSYSLFLAQPESARTVKSNKSKKSPIKMEIGQMQEMNDAVSVLPKSD
jgi:hypothetical protein